MYTHCVAFVLARAAAPAAALVFVTVGTLSVVGRAVGVDVGARGHAHCIVARAPRGRAHVQAAHGDGGRADRVVCARHAHARAEPRPRVGRVK